MDNKTNVLQGKCIYRIAEAAKYLGVSIQTVYRYVDRGLLPKPIKISKRASGWMLADLDKFISDREKESRGGDAA